MKEDKKTYTITLNENQFFIIINLLYNNISQEKGKTPKYKKTKKIMDLFDKEYFNK